MVIPVATLMKSLKHYTHVLFELHSHKVFLFSPAHNKSFQVDHSMINLYFNSKILEVKNITVSTGIKISSQFHRPNCYCILIQVLLFCDKSAKLANLRQYSIKEDCFDCCVCKEHPIQNVLFFCFCNQHSCGFFLRLLLFCCIFLSLNFDIMFFFKLVDFVTFRLPLAL